MVKRSLGLVLAGGLLAGMSLGSAHAASKTSAMMAETVQLKSQSGSMVTGSVKLTTNGKTSTAMITVMHLKPHTIHPGHIHAGRCGSNGPVVVPFRPLMANARGVATESYQFKGNFEHKKWYINIHQGPGLAGKQFNVLACGNIM